MVKKGQVLTEGSIALDELHKLAGRDAVQRYILSEIQEIYATQGQRLNDKHVEIIIKQLFSRVYIEDPGDTDLLPGETVEESQFLLANIEAKKEGQKPSKARELFLGVSKVSLSTQSFLSAASFQETARVLINAAISGKVDHLEGLKENVIIGRLIPVGTGFVGSAPARAMESDADARQVTMKAQVKIPSIDDGVSSPESAPTDESTHSESPSEEEKTD